MGEPGVLQLVLTDFSADDLSEIEVEDIERVILARDDIPGGPFDWARIQDGYAFLHRAGDGNHVTRYRLEIV